jgi:hypothetical protein
MLLNVTVFARFQPEGRHWPPQDLDRRAGSVGAREVPLARVRGRRSAARPWTRFGQWRSAGPARAAGPRRRSRSARRAGGLRRVWPCTVATDAAVDSRRAMTRSAGAAPTARVLRDGGGEAGAQGVVRACGRTARARSQAPAKVLDRRMWSPVAPPVCCGAAQAGATAGDHLGHRLSDAEGI